MENIAQSTPPIKKEDTLDKWTRLNGEITNSNYWSFILATVDDNRVPDDAKLWKTNNITVGMIRNYFKAHPGDRLQFVKLPLNVGIMQEGCTLFFRIILYDVVGPNHPALKSCEEYADQFERKQSE